MRNLPLEACAPLTTEVPAPWHFNDAAVVERSVLLLSPNIASHRSPKTVSEQLCECSFPNISVGAV